MTLHQRVQELFDHLGVQIYDARNKEVSGVDQIMELLHCGRVTNWNETPHYDSKEDKIYIPSDCDHYGDITALHELIHWTGHKKRLERMARYQKEICCLLHARNLEEITAEIGSLMLCENLNVTPKDDSKKMIAGWRSTFRGSQTHTKKEAYAIALRDAEKAVAYILSLSQMERKAA